MADVELLLPGQRVFKTHDWGWEEELRNEDGLITKLVFVKGGYTSPIYRTTATASIFCISGLLAIEHRRAKPTSSIELLLGAQTVRLRNGHSLLISRDTLFRAMAQDDTYVYVTHGAADTVETEDWNGKESTSKGNA